MLVLSRLPGEKLVIDGGRIIVTVVQIDRNKVKIGVEAPKDVTVDREEVHRERIKDASYKPTNQVRQIGDEDIKEEERT